jgi:ATP-dependent Clp protease ATP-binding subunit ClpC
VFERFTERARQVVVFAQDEARALRHNYIGTEHLLLGLLREEEGVAARTLVSVGMTLERARAEVERIVGIGEVELTSGQIPFTPRAKRMLELALREALSMGHNHIGTEHVLLGLSRDDKAMAVKILRNAGIEPEGVQEKVVLMLGPGLRPGSPLPRRGLRRRWQIETLLIGWAMFGVAAAFGLLLGWLIWG